MQFIAIIIFLLTSIANAYADPGDNPACHSLIAIVDRPTIGDSPCVVPYGKIVLEQGYQYQKLPQTGYGQNFPQAALRLGLPKHSELVVVLPNEIKQTITPHSGLTASTVGIKHEMGFSENWTATLESLLTLPSGSDNFGSHGLGAAFNGIFSYNLTSQLNLTFMLGVTSDTQSDNDGGQRFNSINPDLVMSWSPIETISLYGEIYGQSKMGPGQGSGFNMDTGIIYLLTKNITIDLEWGHHVSGVYSNFEQYIGAGFAIIFP